jgi:Tfp pilus assembly protein PilN
VLDEVGDGVRSAAEAWARSLIHRSSLPTPQWNVLIKSAAGKWLAVVDGWWDDVGLAWQIDSLEFHLAPDDYTRTMTQHSALSACGVLTVHTVPSRLKSDPADVVEELRGAYKAAAQRARPHVSATLWRPI